ncbi:MAG: HD domain-containing protein [Phycisphaerae bacterium]|nr:HD domain-containing protein [Phycisphaerae bacterium]
MLKTSRNRLSFSQLKLLKNFGRDMAQLGVNFLVYDSDLHIVVSFNGEKFISDYEAITACAKHAIESEPDTICSFGKSDQILAAGVKIGDRPAAVVAIDCGTDLPLQQQSTAYVRQILKMFLNTMSNEVKSSQQIELISNELAQTYEELMLLYKMSTNMKVSRTDLNYLQMACDSLTELVKVEGIAIFLEKKINNSKKLVLTAGTGLIAIDHKNGNMHEVLFERLLSEIKTGSEALLDSEVDAPFRYEWFGRVRNIIAVPLHGKDKIIGMMVATNRLDKADFDSIDVKLFGSVATECAVFIENQNLFKELKELFIGSLKALTSSIDAKDQYTRGHSERVAFISKWIAERCAQAKNLSAEEIQKIYLAGLLHDIGKIGIPESVLSKDGKLTAEEYEQMKAHSSIGAGILSEINQMADIIPGVLYHHERYDGKGYPKGLAGDDIPIAGKIVMIADSFDAMTSRRTYRKAMDFEAAKDEIERELGKQFDPEIGSIFLNSDIDKLWEIIQNGKADDIYSDSFGEYGTIAVGALLG